MKVQSFSMRMDVEQARELSLKRAGPIGRFAVRKQADEVRMKTIFIENKIITFRITNEPFILTRWLRPNRPKHQSLIRVIANGSTCGVSYYDGDGVEIVEADVEQEQLQYSDYPDSRLVTRGNALARRILRRRVGGNISLETVGIESVFRPYHVAFFGELAEGNKVRYIPVPADGCSVKRTF